MSESARIQVPRVLHRPRCPFCRRLRGYVAEKGLEVELVRFDPERDEAELRRLTPKGQVPTYEEPGGVVLYESLVIMEYLEETHPKPALMPTDPKLRARTRLLFDLADHRLAAPLLGFARLPLDHPDRNRQHDALISLATDAERLLDDKSDFAFDRRFSLADLSVPPMLLRALEAGLGFGELSPRVRAWLVAAARRPSLRALFPEAPAG
jgi:glutathione S-transferase